MQSTMTLQESQQGGLSATTTTNTIPVPTKHPCNTTYGSMKRPSPSSPLHEPSLKKPAIQGFSKLALPIPFPSPSPSTTTLRRTISEPINDLSTTKTTNAPFTPFSNSLAASGQFLNPQVQENTKITSPSPLNATHGLLRSISDPTSLAFGLTTRDSPSSQRLEKMKSIIKGISQWCDQVMHEDEDSFEDNKKNDSDSDCDGDQEAVSVKRKGDCLEVHFSCPCGKGYQILLAGKNCYYKLM